MPLDRMFHEATLAAMREQADHVASIQSLGSAILREIVAVTALHYNMIELDTAAATSSSAVSLQIENFERQIKLARTRFPITFRKSDRCPQPRTGDRQQMLADIDRVEPTPATMDEHMLSRARSLRRHWDKLILNSIY